MRAGGDEPQAPIDMVNKILISDPSILGVVATDEKGNKLALAVKGEIPEKRELSEDFVKKASMILTVVKGAVSQYEPLFGRLQSVTVKFETSQVAIFTVPELRMVFGLRVTRSADIDYVVTSVFSILGIVGKAERNQGASGKDALRNAPPGSRDITP